MDNTRVGEWVMAYGSPLALRNSLTVGIVSNKNRLPKELGLKNALEEFRYLQTDAIINVSNSSSD